MSGFIPERILDEIRFRNDIVEVIGAYVPLKRAGSTYKACCPFHREKTPSFNVNPNMQIFKCFGCGEGGDVISFVMKHQGLDFVTAARTLAERAGIAIEVEADNGEGAQRKVLYEIHHGIAQFYRRCLEKYPAAQKARDYVAERKLDGEAVEAFQIGYAPAGWDNALKWAEKYGFSADQLEQAGLVLRSVKQDRRGVFYDRFRDRLMFPIQDSQGRVIAFSARLLVNDPKQPKYVNSPETPVFSKGRVLYGLDKARRHIVNTAGREALICEGQIDVVRCHLCGFPTAVAAQGTAFTDDHVQLLKNYADSVLLVFDADAAGQAAALKTAHLFMKAGLVARVVVLPPGEDPDSFLRVNGPDAFRERLEHAVSAVSFQIGVLGASEPDMRGIAATARIAKAALETIACSPHAVQRERMLQEAAALLGLPQHALEADLAVVEAGHKAQVERYASRGGRAPGAGVRESGATTVAASPPPENGEPFIEGDAYEEEPPAEVLDMLRRTDVPAGSSVPPGGGRTGASRDGGRPVRVESMPGEERALCEHLAQGESDAYLAELVLDYLPPAMLGDPLCRRFVEMALVAFSEGNPLSVYLEQGKDGSPDEALRAFAAALRAQPVRVKTGGDYTRRDAVQDLILGFWRRHLQQVRKRLALPAQDGSETANSARRRQLAIDLKSLDRWETGQDVILIERAMPDVPPAAGSAAG